MDPKRQRVYVSGVADSKGRSDQETPAGTPGKDGDVLHVFAYSAGSGTARETGTIPVPPPPDAAAPQDFPPAPQGKQGRVARPPGRSRPTATRCSCR